MSRSLHDDSLRTGQGRHKANEPASQQALANSRDRDGKAIYRLRGENYRLSPKQSKMLQDLGAFRIITAQSLRNHIYRGDQDRFDRELRNLRDQGLVVVQPGSSTNGGYLALTRAGKTLTEAGLRTNAHQVVYSGVVKKRELRHDAAIYDVYQKEIQKIFRSGGTPKRVVLDFELKKQVNRRLANLQNLLPEERERKRHEIADAHGLKIVQGKIQFPDLRIEYESRDQEQCRVDLECVTGHYKARQIAAKTAAGFKLYNQDYRGRSAERGEDLIGEVMSL